MDCSRSCLPFMCLTFLCFLGIPIWMDPPFNLPVEFREKLFRDFVIKYNKSYANGSNPQEYQKRLGIFSTALTHTAELNALHGDKGGSIKYGVTRFSDMSEDEFLSLYLNKHIAIRLKKNQVNEVTDLNDVERAELEKYSHAYAIKRTIEEGLPKTVDWRNKNVIPAVRKQGLCGACWAYSVISNIESMIGMRNQTIIPLSTQQMVDCARNGNMGCDGGDTCMLLEWLKYNEVKIETNDEYPENNEPNSTCSENPNLTDFYSVSDFSCKSYVNSEEKLLSVLASYGPVTVAVNAMLWQHYLGGIIQFHCDGSVTNLNHAALIVGYDRSGPVPHYIVQNSWGSEFGDNGYVKIAYGKNVCGIANQVSTIKLA